MSDNNEVYEIIHKLLSGRPKPALEYAENHEIETKPHGDYFLTLRHEEDALNVYPARNKLARKILEHNME